MTKKLIGIVGRKKGNAIMRAFDYEQGEFVINIIHQTLWPIHQLNHVMSLISFMNKENSEYEFKLVKR